MKAWYVESKLTPACGRDHQTEAAKELAAKKNLNAAQLASSELI